MPEQITIANITNVSLFISSQRYTATAGAVKPHAKGEAASTRVSMAGMATITKNVTVTIDELLKAIEIKCPHQGCNIVLPIAKIPEPTEKILCPICRDSGGVPLEIVKKDELDKLRELQKVRDVFTFRILIQD